MRIPGIDDCHLTYCLNVHPTRNRVELDRAVFTDAASVRRHLREMSNVAKDDRFGLGLWLSDVVAREMDDAETCRDFADRMAQAGFYSPTFNGFPFGVFHDSRVKQSVYQPDWSDARRKEYTVRLARIMACILPDDISEGSISTVPVTYRAWCDQERLGHAIEMLQDTLRDLARIEESTGRRIRLALEPEPDCLLDDCESTLAFWEQLRALSSVSEHELLDRYLGICLDTAHTSTLFEDAADVLNRLASHDIPVVKMQIAAVPQVCEALSSRAEELLMPFRDEIYLHQTCIQTASDEKRRYPDLPDAFAVLRHGRTNETSGTWRTHYHVPLGWTPEGDLQTSASDVNARLMHAARAHGVRHFELEIYSLGLMLDTSEQMHRVLADDLKYLQTMLYPNSSPSG